MADPKPDFNQVLSDLLDERTKEPLTREEMAAWRGGDLSEQQRLALQDRLVLDKVGVSQLLAEKEQAAPTLEDAEASWAIFEKRLDAVTEDEMNDVPFPEAHPPKIPVEAPKPPWYYRPVNGAVAALLLVSILLAFQLKNSQTGASLNYADYYVDWGEASRGDNDTIVLSGGGLFVQLRVPRQFGDFAVWQVSLFDPAGKRIFTSQSGLREKRKLNLSVPYAEFTSAGSYRIEVSGIENGKPVKLNLDSIQLTIEL